MGFSTSLQVGWQSLNLFQAVDWAKMAFFISMLLSEVKKKLL
jgi:hypothetical protein